MFMLTKPTCDEMEQIRTGGYLTEEFDENTGTSIVHQGVNDGYEYSSFGYLEKRLNDENLFPVYPIDDK